MSAVKGWWKVYTDRSPNGAFFQAVSEAEARAAAERSGYGNAVKAKPVRE